jgi:hypothetical protein
MRDERLQQPFIPEVDFATDSNGKRWKVGGADFYKGAGEP